MKKPILTLIMLMTGSLHACPTCIGRLDQDTPPIFTKEYDDKFWATEARGTVTENKSQDDKTVPAPMRKKQ